MNREILFRGKRLKNGEWVEGCLFVDDKGEKHEILVGYVNYRIAWEVDPDTVGQYTGFKDGNGERIFEGDIVRFTRINALGYLNRRVGEVCYYDELPLFYIMATTGDAWDWCECNHIEVIGNIHDNPELLKGEQE